MAGRFKGRVIKGRQNIRAMATPTYVLWEVLGAGAVIVMVYRLVDGATAVWTVIYVAAIASCLWNTFYFWRVRSGGWH